MKFLLKNFFPGFLIILSVWPSVNLEASITITSNNPFLRIKDCSGVIINDSSPSFESREINFGDGTGVIGVYNSLPHQYINEGTFIVKYFKYYSPFVIDSFIDTVQISLSTKALFNYKTYTAPLNYGITHFSFLTINKTITDDNYGSVVYDDYTCSDQCFAVEGKSYPATAITDTVLKKYITVFLDANGDGKFQKTEIVGESDNIENHLFQITIPYIPDSLIGHPLRLRVVCTNGIVPFLHPGSGHWYNVNSIQDYSIIITNPNTDPPIASFKAYHNCDGLNVQFVSTCTGAPDSVKWVFENSVDSTGFAPNYTFSNLNNQSVQLIAYNNFGIDTLNIVLESPASPNIVHTDPAIINEPILFQTTEFPKSLTWRWTFPEIPMQTFDQTPTNIYTTSGSYPYTLTLSYVYSYFSYGSAISCNITIDDTIVLLNTIISENEHFNDLSIYTNNEYSVINISSNYSGDIFIQTFDIAGRIENEFKFIKNTSDINCKIHFDHKGLYFIRIKIGDHILSRKILSLR